MTIPLLILIIILAVLWDTANRRCHQHQQTITDLYAHIQTIKDHHHHDSHEMPQAVL